MSAFLIKMFHDNDMEIHGFWAQPDHGNAGFETKTNRWGSLMKGTLITCYLTGFFTILACSGSAIGQEQSVPTFSCDKPRIPERYSVATEDLQYMEKQAKIYGDCTTHYINDRQAQIKKLEAMVKAEAEAGNAATIDFNNLMAKVRAVEKANKPEHEEGAIDQNQ